MSKTEIAQLLGARSGRIEAAWNIARRELDARMETLGVAPFQEHTNPETAKLAAKCERLAGQKSVYTGLMSTLCQTNALRGAYYKAQDEAQANYKPLA